MPPKKQEKLEFSGILDIRQAEDLHNTFGNLKDGKTNIVLDFSKVDDIDFAVIQMIFSFSNHLAEKKRQLILKSVNEKVSGRFNLCDCKSLLQEN
ncbi:MAG: STAS domain-containing protein [Spirochaetales bacterium]|nr:STAS domain-containing protein [Spirochaetales bacterium]